MISSRHGVSSRKKTVCVVTARKRHRELTVWSKVQCTQCLFKCKKQVKTSTKHWQFTVQGHRCQLETVMAVERQHLCGEWRHMTGADLG